MRKRKISLKYGLLTTIVTCWLVPILIVMTLAGVLFGQSYRKNVYQEVDVSLESALRQVRMQLESAIVDSKNVSYDGVIREGYRNYQATGNRANLYRHTNDYLSQSFFRKSQYNAVSIHYWSPIVDVNSYYFSSGTTGYELLNQCQENTPWILSAMENADTDILFLTPGNQLCMSRNLMDSNYVPYASVVIMLDTQMLFRPLMAISRISQIQIQIDNAVFRLENDIVAVSEKPGTNWEISRQAEADGHSICVEANIQQYDVWEENPWMFWSVLSVALLVLPLLLLMISLYYRHITRPMEVLAQAYTMVQAGQRGYAIEQAPPNAEFAKLYQHFNSMSADLKKQFEQSFLEQRATQKAQIKALQSQINPHFLNNTLEIINWEARFAGNDRISAMIEALSTMLGAALDRDGRTQIPLSEELGYVDAYLYIIRERLGGNLCVSRQIAPDMDQQLIPRLILQPIVENAVEHDIVSRRGGRLILRAYMQEENIVLEVEHNGTMTETDRENINRLLSRDPPVKGQVGLKNVYRRLKLLYADAGTLTIEEVRPETILARICFPKS